MVLYVSSERDSNATLSHLNATHYATVQTLCVQLTAYCPRQRVGEEASWSGGKHCARSTDRVISVSKTLPGNLQDSAVSLKQF